MINPTRLQYTGVRTRVMDGQILRIAQSWLRKPFFLTSEEDPSWRRLQSATIASSHLQDGAAGLDLLLLTVCREIMSGCRLHLE